MANATCSCHRTLCSPNHEPSKPFDQVDFTTLPPLLWSPSNTACLNCIAGWEVTQQSSRRSELTVSVASLLVSLRGKIWKCQSLAPVHGKLYSTVPTSMYSHSFIRTSRKRVIFQCDQATSYLVRSTKTKGVEIMQWIMQFQRLWDMSTPPNGHVLSQESSVCSLTLLAHRECRVMTKHLESTAKVALQNPKVLQRMLKSQMTPGCSPTNRLYTVILEELPCPLYLRVLKTTLKLLRQCMTLFHKLPETVYKIDHDISQGNHMSCCIVFCPPFYPAAYAQGTPWVGKIDDSLVLFWGESLLLPSQAQKKLNHPKCWLLCTCHVLDLSDTWQAHLLMSLLQWIRGGLEILMRIAISSELFHRPVRNRPRFDIHSWMVESSNQSSRSKQSWRRPKQSWSNEKAEALTAATIRWKPKNNITLPKAVQGHVFWADFLHVYNICMYNMSYLMLIQC